ncbi:MAG: methyltransferase domain-containing protein [Sphingobacteriales bacterium]|nr:MAG: methyltransferase domain-containing protein [Sphingobacteriales bacterium]
MKISLSPENILERIAVILNLAPLPLLETQIAFNGARAIMAASDTGIFEAMGKESRTYDQIAEIAGTHSFATKQLLDSLTAMGYVTWSEDKYKLKPKYYKWLLKEYPSNLIGKLRFQKSEWNWMAKLEDFVKTGQPMDLHSILTEQEWADYQDGMRDLSVNTAKELAGKIKLPANASKMLDIGGSHGLYSIELCKKHPSLNSTILELPGAIDRASAIAAEHGLQDRVKYQAGNALTDDLGTEQYDFIMINNVVHHFTAEQNQELAKKVARALKKGGLFGIGEFIRLKKPGEGGAVAALAGLYFSLTSQSGTWSEAEIRSWQSNAGLTLQKPTTLMSLPGWKMVVAQKS